MLAWLQSHSGNSHSNGLPTITQSFLRSVRSKFWQTLWKSHIPIFLLQFIGLVFNSVETCAELDSLLVQRSQMDLYSWIVLTRISCHLMIFEGVILFLTLSLLLLILLLLLLLSLLLLINNINQQHLFPIQCVFPYHACY